MASSPLPKDTLWTYFIPLYVGWRVYWANRLPIMDCDEVYNYWEPLHFWLFESGFQTWEYANQYALRTYAYLTPLWLLARALQPVMGDLPSSIWPLLTTQVVQDNSKVALFVLLRAVLAGTTAVAELYFCQALSEIHSSYRMLGWTTSLLLMTSAGMAHASGALLPSSTMMMLWLVASAAYLKKNHLLFVVVAISATLAVGWPFGCLLFVPMGLSILLQEYTRSLLLPFLGTILLLTIGIQGLVMSMDFYHYGKWVSPTWNILMYNTKSGGDELYGIEPTSYYVKNLLLNFNLLVVGMILVIPVLLVSRSSTVLPIVLSSMYLWLAVVVPRPHKEERFLYPIYPSICLSAALVGEAILSLASNRPNTPSQPQRQTPLGTTNSFMLLGQRLLLWSPAMVLGLCRIMALSKYYTAPLIVYAALQQQQQVPRSSDSKKKSKTIVCTCGEWYRFPSSFYLPNNQTLAFLQSGFRGQLPAPFTTTGSRHHEAYHFNNLNQLETDRFTIKDMARECDYLIDLFDSTDCREQESIWYPYVHAPFLKAERTSTIHRTLYIPYWHEQADLHGGVEYVDFILYAKDESLRVKDEESSKSSPRP